MKILYHHRVASKDGQYVHIDEIILQLKRQGQEVTMVCPVLADKSAFGSSGGLVSSLKRHMPQAIYELLELSYNLLIFAKLVRAIVRHKPDVIYERYNLFTVAGVWAARLFRLPLLLEINAPLFDERQRFNGIALKRLARATESYCWRNADRALPVTQVLADQVHARGVPHERISVIPNGVEPERFNPQIPPAPLPAGASGRLVVGFVGFCREWHELDRVVELIADAKFDHLFLLIVGDGPARQGIEAAAQRMGIQHRVHLTGLISREQMPQWQAAIDIALQPAVVAYASPLKMLEYMACAKAIVAPDQANIRELLTHEQNALLFAPQDTDQFLEAIARLAADPPLRRQLGQAALSDIQTRPLTWAHNATRIIALATGLQQRPVASSAAEREQP